MIDISLVIDTAAKYNTASITTPRPHNLHPRQRVIFIDGNKRWYVKRIISLHCVEIVEIPKQSKGWRRHVRKMKASRS